MKIVTRKNNRLKIIVAVAAVVLLLGALYAVYATTTKSWPFSENSNSSSENTETKSSKELEKDSSPENDAPIDKTPVRYTPVEESIDSSNDEITGIINFNAVSEGNLVIRTTINNDGSVGNCKLTLTKQSSGQTITKKSTIITNPHTSTCQGFDIPVAELSSGVWDISILVTSAERRGVLSSSVTI